MASQEERVCMKLAGRLSRRKRRICRGERGGRRETWCFERRCEYWDRPHDGNIGR